MREEIAQIYDAFEGKLIGTRFMKRQVCEVLLLMPKKIINYVTSKCWFLASMDDAWAFAFTGNDLKDSHMIFLSDDLLSQDLGQIRYSIAHEIGHVVLGHRNSILAKQTKQEVKKQENEADKFAKQYLVQSAS